MKGFQISTELVRMDIELIHSELTQSYWARGVSRETVVRSVENSLCFGVFTDRGEQVGFARAITDTATFAYVADVFVIARHQGRGLGKWLMQSVMDHPRLHGLRRILLATRDAHGLYQPFGFAPLSDPDLFMERWRPGALPDDQRPQP